MVFIIRAQNEGQDVIWMIGDGCSEDWFLAKNSGRKRREIDPSGSDATSDDKLLRARTLQHLWPEARTTRKAALSVSCFRDISLTGSYGERR